MFLGKQLWLNRLVQRLQCNASSRVDVNGQSVQADKKSEKRKKVLGKGTSVLMQFITDTVQRGVGEVDDHSALLEKWVQNLLSLFDPKHSGFLSLF